MSNFTPGYDTKKTYEKSRFFPCDHSEKTNLPAIPKNYMEITCSTFNKFSCNDALSPSIDSEVIRPQGNDSLFNTSSTCDLSNQALNTTKSIESKGLNTILCSCGNECPTNSISCYKCLENIDKKETVGYLYLKKEEAKLERFWCKLLNKEIYCMEIYSTYLGYNKKSDTTYEKMIELSNTIVTKGKDFSLPEGNILYPIVLITQKCNKVMYAYKKTEQEEWLRDLKKAIGYSNINEIYEIAVIYMK